MSQKPFIGVTADSLVPTDNHSYPLYLLKQNYATRIAEAGGVPFLLPHEVDCVDAYLARLDGLLVSGGGHDIDPALYGDTTLHPTVVLNSTRVAFELAITRAALERNMPVLGICGGHQVINVVLGGTLIQHIPETHPQATLHSQTTPAHEQAHSIQVSEGTLLHQIIGHSTCSVNSFHHQAIRDPGLGVVVNARAPDGIIEGIEVPEYSFCLGVQWHPERMISPQHSGIFKAFIEAAAHG